MTFLLSHSIVSASTQNAQGDANRVTIDSSGVTLSGFHYAHHKLCRSAFEAFDYSIK